MDSYPMQSGMHTPLRTACGLLVVATCLSAQTPATEPKPLTLDRFVVTPSRFDFSTTRPGAATLTQQDLETLPQIGEDLYRSITRLPGVAADDFTARFWVRGAPNRQLLVRLDGADLLEPFHLKDVDGALAVIDLHAISQLDLMTGGFNADYGNAAAGVLTMETLSPARDQREVHAATMLCCGVFRMPAAAQAMLNATWYDKRWTVWVARNGVNVIGAALSFVAQGVAWFGWDATLPDHRGQGVHHALIAARLNQAREQGCRIATAETATHVHDRPDPSGRNYEKLGFVLAYSRHTYAAMRPAVRPMGPLG